MVTLFALNNKNMNPLNTIEKHNCSISSWFQVIKVSRSPSTPGIFSPSHRVQHQVRLSGSVGNGQCQGLHTLIHRKIMNRSIKRWENIWSDKAISAPSLLTLLVDPRCAGVLFLTPGAGIVNKWRHRGQARVRVCGHICPSWAQGSGCLYSCDPASEARCRLCRQSHNYL